MRLNIFAIAALAVCHFDGIAQEKSADTVVVPLGSSSKIIFTMEDRSDMDVLRNYDYQLLFNDILNRLEGDSSELTLEERTNTNTSTDPNTNTDQREAGREILVLKEANSDTDEDEKKKRGIGRTWHTYNLDLGTNNYLDGDQFPTGNEPYAVRPWGSWYIAGNSVQRTRIGRNFFAEWSLGISWYNFKFQEDNTVVVKDEQGVHFVADQRELDYVKSKLSATFINASLVPLVDFGEHRHKPRVWEGHGDGFRFGIGPYVGYRIASKSKLVYELDGDKEKEKDRDNFYLNNLRYGLRIQIGVRSTDIFINYDMNSLFAEGKGPDLKAISFGLTF